ncbi:MAG: hypothetical protein M0Z61_14375 [Nitrospiraceae bacterium]|nr:hypothetical protein [Nitrospiraceae bacterium]
MITLLLFSALTGNASAAKVKVVKPGDVVDIHFLCWFKNGQIAAATDKAIEQRKDMPKSPVFLPRAKDGAIPVIATGVGHEQPEEKDKPFELEIADRLAGVVTGMKEGESRTVILKAGNLPYRTPKDYVVRVARIRVRPKEMKMAPGDYKVRKGKDPKPGQPFIVDPAVKGRVETVTKDAVIIRFSAKPGTLVSTPFGPGRIRETKNAYEIVIDAKKGSLVRTGAFVGRISGVDGNFITVDYRDPFGGEALTCYAGVEKIEKKKEKIAKKDK